MALRGLTIGSLTLSVFSLLSYQVSHLIHTVHMLKGRCAFFVSFFFKFIAILVFHSKHIFKSMWFYLLLSALYTSF